MLVQFGICFELARTEVAAFLYGVSERLGMRVVFGSILGSWVIAGVGTGIGV